MDEHVTRRGSLVRIGGIVAGALATGGLAADASEGASPALPETFRSRTDAHKEACTTLGSVP